MRKLIIPIMNFLAVFSRISENTAGKHFIYNSGIWSMPGTESPYILNQNKLSALKYGKERWLWKKLIAKGAPLTAAFNSCEVIAAMNALVHERVEDDTKNFPALLHYFERGGIILSGYFGTSPGSLLKYLMTRGLNITPLSLKALDSNKKSLAESFSTYIFVTQNGIRLFSEVHTMCIIKDKKGYRLLNDFEGNKTYPSLIDAVTGYNDEYSTPLALWGVRGKNE